MLAALLASCTEEEKFPNKFTDPRDGRSYHQMEVAGVTWMRDDLKFGDSLYSYQQALFACPPGWSLPTEDDWASLAEFFGGYETYNAEVGSPAEAYHALTGTGFSGFGASKSFYWTSTPAWVDGAIVRSFSFRLDSLTQRAVLAGSPNSSKMLCRCVKRNASQNEANFAVIRAGGQSLRFDLHTTLFPPEYRSGKVAAYLYTDLQENQLVNRLIVDIKLPGQYVTSEEGSASLHSSIAHQVVTNNNYQVNSLQQNGEAPVVHITFYDGKKIKGRFSGITTGSGLAEAMEGEFELVIVEN